MKIKTALITAVLSISALTINVSAAVETTKITEVTETTVSTTRHIPTAGSIVIDSNKIETGEFFDEIMDYVGSDNAANLNENLKNNALAINSTTIDYSDKSMFTITTRSGDVFYLIINNSDGSCLFLNTVDTADLTSLLNKENGTNTLNENAVSDVEEMKKEQAEADKSADKEKTNAAKITSEGMPNKESTGWMGNFIWIICAAVCCVLVALTVCFIKSKKGKHNSSYNDSFAEDMINDDRTDEFEEAESYMDED